MRLEELKKGFWGYQKDAVFQYITQQEEAFTQKMTEKDALLERTDRHARASAEALKAETRAQEESAREKIRQALEQDLAELARYREKAADLRKAVQAAMEGLEQQAEKMERETEELYEAAPKGNLTLFQ